LDNTEFKKLIQFAMDKEEEAAAFYRDCSERASHKEMKETFIRMAGEEEGHKSKIERFNRENIETGALKKIPNLKISDYLLDMTFRPNMNYAELLVLAMKREEKAHTMYTDLAGQVDDPSVSKLFQTLAQEELKHKLRLETEYDDEVQKEN